VVDLLQIPQLAMVTRRQGFSGWTDEDIPGRIVAELVLGEETLAHRRSALRLGDMGRETRLLAGFDILDLEVTPIGDDIDALDAENGAGRLGCLRQQADVRHRRLLDDHFVLRVDCDLRVVADANLRMAAIARLSGSVSDIWLSPVRSSSASIAP